MSGAQVTPALQDGALKVARTLLAQPAMRDLVHRGFEVRDQALRLQSATLSALNLPTAADLATVLSRLRSISQRLELIEDALDDVAQAVARLQTAERTIPSAGGSGESG